MDPARISPFADTPPAHCTGDMGVVFTGFSYNKRKRKRYVPRRKGR